MEKPDPSKNGSSTSRSRLRFAQFMIDPANRTLSRDGKEIKTTGKDFDLLVFFALNPGRLLGKDELLLAVWPGSFVEEGNLARHVSTLRKLLDDTDREHKFIATVQGKGYRFLTEVEPDVADPPHDERSITRDRHLNSTSWTWGVAFVIVVAGFAVLWSGSSLLRRNPVPFDDVRPIKLTQDGNVYSPVISPDGQYLAYVCEGEMGGHAICLRQNSTGSVLRIISARNGVQRWGTGIAPDNRFVYFISKGEGVDHGILYRVPLIGGTQQKIAEHISGYKLSPDGQRIALVKRDLDAGHTSILTIHNDGTDERHVLSTELESAYYSLGWSPDGRNILYSVRRQTAEGELRYVAEIPAEGGAERRLNVAQPAQISNIQWMPDKSGFIAAATDEVTRQRQLYFISYPEGKLHRLTNDVQGFDYFSMTADGRTGVAPRMYDNRRIWVISGDGVPAAITNDTEKHFDTVEWASGDHLVFDQDENSSYGGRNIWRMRPDGSERKQLTFGEGGNTQPTLSPDGRTIAFVSYRSGKSQLWRMDIDGGGLVQLTELPHNIAKPRYTYDGQFIYFDAWVNGMSQVWRCSPDGRDPAPVIEGVDVRTWTVSPDGSRVLYSYFDRASGKEEARLRDAGMSGTGEPAGFLPENWMEWSRDGRSIYFNTAEDGARNIWRKDLGAAQPTQVTRFTGESLFDCSWSPDGVRAACIRQMLTSDAVMIRF